MHSHSNAPALALRAIGMHPKYAGYGYSLAILRITHRHPEYIYRLPKMVYPRIMELFGCTRSALDRNIRFAIERTWKTETKRCFRNYLVRLERIGPPRTLSLSP